MNSTPSRGKRAFTTGGAYAMLVLLGLLEGVIGCFQFSRSVGTAPVAAWVLCVVVFATCLLSGIGMNSVMGALVPAVAWFAASFVLTLPTPAGSIIVTNTAAGMWYLYGGAGSAAIGVMAVYVIRFRAQFGRRPGTGRPPPGRPG